MARMKNLKDISGETIYPKTVASAVMFDGQNTMSALASNGLYVAGETQDFEEIDSINADTLQGHNSDYFASKQDLNTAVTELDDKINELSVSGGGGIIEETDPTVPAWAKEPTKPSYTASEVGALPSSTAIPSKLSDLTEDATHRVVTDSEKSGWNAKANTTDIPTKVSQLTNDKGYLTEHQSLAGYAKESYVDNKIAEIPTPDVSGQINTHNTDTSTHADIRQQISQLSSDKIGTSQLNTAVENALTQAKSSGEFDGKSAYEYAKEGGYEGTEAEFATDINPDDINVNSIEFISTELAKRGQLKPEFANDVSECTDTSKLYVLPDGFIYAYQYVESTGPSYTNLSETVNENQRMGSGGTLSALTGAITTDFIPVRKGQTIRFKGFDPLVMPQSKYPYICFYTGASEENKVSNYVWERFDWLNEYSGLTQDLNGVWSYTAFMITPYSDGNVGTELAQHPLASSISHIRMCGTMIAGETVIVTVDEEITDGGSTSGYAWTTTGHAFVPADYETEILDLQKNKANKTDIPTKLPNPNALTINGMEYDGSIAMNIETQSGGNILYGKKWVACGDSFTENGYNPSDGFDKSEYIYQDGRFAGRYKVYPNIIGLRNNMNIVNLATGGQTMAATSANNSFMTRYTQIDADADYITIKLGINDKLQDVQVGALDSTDTSTFCGAFNVAMEHILENHPFAHIGIIVSNGTNEAIMQATRNIAERWGVPCLDYGDNQTPLLNRYTGRNVCAKAQEIREKNFCVISDGVNATNAHPNTKAHEYESTIVEAWLRTL